MLPLIILFLFFVTGAVGLAYEVLWIRMLVNVFGATVYAVSSVISAFFAGLALGSHLFGRHADRSKNPLRLYGILECAVGIAALLTLFALTRMTGVWSLIYSSVGTTSLLYPIVRFVLCFSILLVPSTLMGGTLPVLSKYFGRDMRNIGWSIGLLYSVNTFGALVGCFLVGFILIPAIGVRTTLYVGVASNVFVALCALLLSMRKTAADEAPPLDDGAREEAPQRATSPRLALLAMIAFAISGFASLSYELLWTRILVYFLGVQTYAYTIMLITFLFGIAAGSMLFARILKLSKDALLLFGIVEILIGFFSLGGLSTLGRLYDISDFFRMSGFVSSWWHFAGTKFVVAALFMLLPTLLIGGTFPIVIRIVITNVKQVCPGVGRSYALNTIGGIFGSFVTGFLFLPLLGVRNSIVLIVFLNMALGLGLVMLSERRTSLSGLAAGILGALIFVPMFYVGSRNRPVLSEWNAQRKNSMYDILYAKEGIECTLSVLFNRITGARELNINGQSTAYTSYRDIQVHKMLVHLPMLLHPHPRDVLIVGFGMGCTSYESTLYENANVTCVELVKDEIDTAPFFSDLNHNVLLSPNFKFVHDDGRNYIQLNDRAYDVISFNAIHPRLSPALYTREFYQMCRERMAADGLICAWVPTNWLFPREFQSLVKTFLSVFPDSTLWYCNPDHAVLIGGKNEPAVSFETLADKLRNPTISEYMNPANLDDPLSLIGTLVLGPKGLQTYCGGAEVVTDDRSQLEFSRCLDYGLNETVWNEILTVRERYLAELTEIVKSNDPEVRTAIYNNLKSLPPFVLAQVKTDPKYKLYEQSEKDYDTALTLAPQNMNIAHWKEFALDRLAQEKVSGNAQSGSQNSGQPL